MRFLIALLLAVTPAAAATVHDHPGMAMTPPVTRITRADLAKIDAMEKERGQNSRALQRWRAMKSLSLPQQ